MRSSKVPMDVIAGYPVHSEIYISVDEGGDIGSMNHGEYYLLCASSVKDRKRFRDATARFKFGREMKFRKNPKRREQVLKYANPAIDGLFYVAVKKTKDQFDKEEQHIIHERALRKLSDMVLSTETAPYVDVEIDQTSMIPDELAECIFESNRFAQGRSVEADVVESKDSYELQTHDFIVGALGRMYNRHDDYYVGLLDCPKYGYFVSSDGFRMDDLGESRPPDHADAPGHGKYRSHEYLKNVRGAC